MPLKLSGEQEQSRPVCRLSCARREPPLWVRDVTTARANHRSRLRRYLHRHTHTRIHRQTYTHTIGQSLSDAVLISQSPSYHPANAFQGVAMPVQPVPGGGPGDFINHRHCRHCPVRRRCSEAGRPPLPADSDVVGAFSSGLRLMVRSGRPSPARSEPPADSLTCHSPVQVAEHPRLQHLSV